MLPDLANIFRIEVICASDNPWTRCTCNSSVSFCCCNGCRPARNSPKPTNPSKIANPTASARVNLTRELLLIVCPHDVKEIAIIGITHKTGKGSCRITLFHLYHSIYEVVHDDCRSLMSIQSEIRVLESVEV